jgi:uncharacterized protein YkwD
MWCSWFAKNNYCKDCYHYNGQRLITMCLASCNRCSDSSASSSCSDQYSGCSDWATQGYCSPEWEISGKPVRQACAKACGTCGGSTGGSTGSSTGWEADMLARLNQERAKRGLPALCLNKKLSAAAQGHSADMARNKQMTHTGSDGSSVGQRATRAGYTWSGVAENVAAGQASVSEVMRDWVNSPGHYNNIIGRYKHVGFAGEQSRYWTQVFGNDRGSESCA